MRLNWQRLRSASLRELGHAGTGSEEQLWCCYGTEPGALLSVPSGFQSVWLPLAGDLVIDTPQGIAELSGEALVWNGEGYLRGYARSATEYVAAAWPATAAKSRGSRPAAAPATLFSAAQAPTRQLLRAIMRVHQVGLEGSTHWATGLLFEQIMNALTEQQRAFDPLIQRCPGQSRETRRQVFARLLKLRNHISWTQCPELDVPAMARACNYSTSHFIRIFHQVFGETPNDFVLRVRLTRASKLLAQSDLSISEISNQLGFSSGAAFARAMKRQFGRSATQIRRQVLQRGEAAPEHRRLASGAAHKTQRQSTGSGTT